MNEPEKKRRAVIDVGTNSVKLLVADVLGGLVQPIFEDSEQTRLGRGFYETHELQSDAIKNTADAVRKFAGAARDFQSETIRVIATSAARDAKNSSVLTAAIEQASGLKAEIISGEQEADWAFRGVTSNPTFALQSLLILDVGGGSTEFILGSGGRKDFCRSVPMGSVRLMGKIPHSDPPTANELNQCRRWLREFLGREVQPELEPSLHRKNKSGDKTVQLIGTGGTASILARMELKLDEFDRDRIEGVRLTREQILAHMNRLWSLQLEERKKIIGLPPKRADVILTGVAIYEAVMEKFNFDELRVSTRGLRFAAVMEGK